MTTVGRYPTRRGQKVLEKQEEFISRFPESRYSRYLYVSLGLTYRKLGGPYLQRGISLLEKAANYEDFIYAPTALGSLVTTRLRQGELEKAKEYLAILKSKFPDSPATRVAASQVGKVASDRRD